jgi:hypothetical protein
MYYNNTYIGYQAIPDGPILPFYIDQVYWEGDDPADDEENRNEYGELTEDFYDGEEYNDYSERAYEHLMFNGHTIDDAIGHTTRYNIIGYHNPSLVFENPRLGWIESTLPSTEKIWASYVVGRSVKKGVNGSRVNFQLTSCRLWNAFNDFNKPNSERNFYRRDDGYILYRYNTVVARMVDTEISLDPLANYLKRELEELYPLCQIVIQSL